MERIFRLITATRFLQGIYVCLVPFFLFCCALAQNAENSLAAITTALQNKEFETALQLLQPALKASPGNAELWAMQGTAYESEGRSKEALASFQSALKISPNYLPALHGAVQIEYDAGNPAAIPLIERVIRLHPGDTTSHAMLAVLEFQQKNCAVASAHFEKAGGLLDSQPSALHAEAVCLVRLKQLDRAIEILQQTVAMSSDDPKERQILATVQLMAHKPADALETLHPLMQADNQAGRADVETLELASAAYEENKDTAQAVTMLRQAILLDPQNVNCYLDFASVSYAHGAFQVGVDVMTDGITLQPNSAQLYFARGVLYVQLGQYDKAETDFEKAYELDPSQSLSAAAQTLAAAQQNDFDRALTKVQQSLARDPNDPIMLYLQADILAARNADPGTPEFQLAVRSARKAIALRPSLGSARGVLAKLYLKSGRYAEAVEQCRKALDSDPNDQTVVYHLIQGLRKTGKTEEIPGLLKKLADLREQALKKDKERYKYKLVD